MKNAISPATFDLVCTKTGEIVPWDCISRRRSDAEGRLIPERIVSAFEAYGSITRDVMVTVERLDRETTARTGHYEVIPLAALNLQIVPSDFEEQTFEATQPTKENAIMTTKAPGDAIQLADPNEIAQLRDPREPITLNEDEPKFQLDTSELVSADSVLLCFNDFESAVTDYNDALQAFNDAREALDTEVSALRDALEEAMDEIDARLEPAEKARHILRMEIERLEGEIAKIDEQTKEMDEKRSELDGLSDGVSEPDGDEYKIQNGLTEFEDALDLSGICN